VSTWMLADASRIMQLMLCSGMSSGKWCCVVRIVAALDCDQVAYSGQSESGCAEYVRGSLQSWRMESREERSSMVDWSRPWAT
jgi:hypothetical protein